MKAFVKTNNGTFPNVNFFLAWEAFNTMGYSVTLFEEKDILLRIQYIPFFGRFGNVGNAGITYSTA